VDDAEAAEVHVGLLRGVNLYITLGDRYLKKWGKCKCKKWGRGKAAIAEGKNPLTTRGSVGAW